MAIDAQCAACSPLGAPDVVLMEENLRGFVMLLSAHFQGFCRDFITECVQSLAQTLPGNTRAVVQDMFLTELKLNKSNPTFETLRDDFKRLGFDLKSRLGANPLAPAWVTRLGELNAWRNYAAHHNLTPPPAGPPTLTGIRACQQVCTDLAAVFDAELYNYLLALLRIPPW